MSIRSKFENLKAIYESEKKKNREIATELAALQEKYNTLNKSQALIRQVIQTLVDKELKPVSEFVTYSLRKVFYDLDLTFSIQRKDTPKGFTYDFYLKNGLFEAEMDDNFGGSVFELIAFVLRLITIRKKKRQHVIVLDEYFKGIGVKYRANLIELLGVLCSTCDFDILLITHDMAFSEGADNVLQAYLTQEGLKVREIAKSKRDTPKAEEVAENLARALV